MINLEERGIVRSTDAEYIYVEVVRASACGGHCSTCAAKCAESKSEIIKFPNTIHAQVGDVVVVRSNSKSVLSYICLVYGLPLIVMIVAISVSNLLFSFLNIERKDLYSFFIGIICLMLSYLIIKKIDSKYEKKAHTLMMVEKIKEPYEY